MFIILGDSDSCIDVILPGGWGGVSWTCLVQCGAVAVGVDNEVHLAKEEWTPCPCYLHPDTPAGQRYTAQLALDRRDAYFRMPPDKRCNYIKFGVQFPFEQPWHKLVKSLKGIDKNFNELGAGLTQEVLSQLGIEDSEQNDKLKPNSVQPEENVWVMRNTRYIRTLDHLICQSGSRRRIFRGPNEDGTDFDTACITKEIDCTEMSDTFELIERTSRGSLIRVLITVMGKGTVEPCAMICLPTQQDMNNLKTGLFDKPNPNRNFADPTQEPRRSDPNDEERKRRRQQQKSDLVMSHFLYLIVS